MSLVGLFDVDSHIYFVNSKYVVMDNPLDNNILMLVRRGWESANEKEVIKILNRLNMLKFGEPFYRSDGLWCQKLQPNGAKNEKNGKGDNRNKRPGN